jgi:phosphoribosylformylglycinamidine synthase
MLPSSSGHCNLTTRDACCRCRGLVFVGGFSYADVLDSAKGWAAGIRFNGRLLEQFKAFYQRPDTFSLGICNGCQLMALLGLVPALGQDGAALPDLQQPRFVHNASGRFESRWVGHLPASCVAS